MEKDLNTIQVVEWQGSHNPIWEEVGEIKIIKVGVGYNSDEEELCIDIEDLLNWIKYRR